MEICGSPSAAVTAAKAESARAFDGPDVVGRTWTRPTVPWRAGWDGHDLAFAWPPTGNVVAGVTATAIGLYTLPCARPLHDVPVPGVADLAWASDATHLVAVTREFNAVIVNVAAAAAGLPAPRAVRRILAGVDIRAAAFAPPPADHVVLQDGANIHVVGRDGSPRSVARRDGSPRQYIPCPAVLSHEAWLHVPAGGALGLLGVQPWRFEASPFALLDLARCDIRVPRYPAPPVVVLAPSGSRYATQAESPADVPTVWPRRPVCVRESAGDAVLFAVTTTYWATAIVFSSKDDLAVVAAESCRVYAPSGLLRYRTEFAARTATWAQNASAVAFVGHDSIMHVDLTLPTARAQRLQWRGHALVEVALSLDGGTVAVVTSASGGGGGHIAPDGGTAAAASRRETLRIIDLARLTARLTAAFDPTTPGRTALHWSPDGTRLALERRSTSAAVRFPGAGPAEPLATAAPAPRGEVALFELP